MSQTSDRNKMMKKIKTVIEYCPATNSATAEGFFRVGDMLTLKCKTEEKQDVKFLMPRDNSYLKKTQEKEKQKQMS